MTAKKKPARVLRTPVTGWGVLLLPLFKGDTSLLLTMAWHDDINLPVGLKDCSPLRFHTKKDAVAWWKRHREASEWRKTWKVRIVRITGTYEEAK